MIITGKVSAVRQPTKGRRTVELEWLSKDVLDSDFEYAHVLNVIDDDKEFQLGDSVGITVTKI